MRAPILLSTLLALPAIALAQEQERKMLDRIQRPNMELQSAMQGKAFAGGGGVVLRDAPIARSFAGVKDASARDFAGTKSFLGIKNPWFGNRVYPAGDAALMARGLPTKANSTYAVSDARVGDFAASGKKANLGPSDVHVQPFEGRGGAQGAMDQISDKVRKEMTIDELRELLNKPR